MVSWMNGLIELPKSRISDPASKSHGVIWKFLRFGECFFAYGVCLNLQLGTPNPQKPWVGCLKTRFVWWKPQFFHRRFGCCSQCWMVHRQRYRASDHGKSRAAFVWKRPWICGSLCSSSLKWFLSPSQIQQSPEISLKSRDFLLKTSSSFEEISKTSQASRSQGPKTRGPNSWGHESTTCARRLPVDVLWSVVFLRVVLLAYYFFVLLLSFWKSHMNFLDDFLGS